MPTSPRYKQLVLRAKKLRQHLLPKDFSPTGTYTILQRDHARGFSLLVHAEIESFLEEISKNLVVKKLRAWKRRRKPSQVIVCLLAAYQAEIKTPEVVMPEGDSVTGQLDVKPPVDSVDDSIQKAASQYFYFLNRNNGVKEENLKHVLVPIGVRLDDLDQTWLTDLNEFSKRRGQVAHTASRTQHPIDPKTELDTTKRLLSGLQKVDLIVSRLSK